MYKQIFGMYALKWGVIPKMGDISASLDEKVKLYITEYLSLLFPPDLMNILNVI
jgi:hypothetical protein